MITEFEYLYLPELDPELNYRHHEEGGSSQKSFEKQVTSLIQVVENYGGLFMDACPELLVLNTRDCANSDVLSSVCQIETLGQSQYEEFNENIIDTGSKSINDSIQKNKFPFFSVHPNRRNPRKRNK